MGLALRSKDEHVKQLKIMGRFAEGCCPNQGKAPIQNPATHCFVQIWVVGILSKLCLAVKTEKKHHAIWEEVQESVGNIVAVHTCVANMRPCSKLPLAMATSNFLRNILPQQSHSSPGIPKYKTWTRWWFQIQYFLFSPYQIGEMIQFDEHILKWVGSTTN